MTKSNDWIPSPNGSEGTCFFEWLFKYIPRKKWHGCLMKKAAATLRCSEKQVLSKRIKAAISKCSLK